MNGIILFTIITFILSIVLVTLDYFINKKSTKVEMIVKMLPQYNCGKCGYGSCTGLATELLNDITVIDKCKMCKNKVEIKKYLR